MKDTRLPKCVMFGEFVGRALCAVGKKMNGWRLLFDLRAFGIHTDQWIIATQDESGRYKMVKQGAELFTTKWIAAERASSALRYTGVCSTFARKT